MIRKLVVKFRRVQVSYFFLTYWFQATGEANTKSCRTGIMKFFALFKIYTHTFTNHVSLVIFFLFLASLSIPGAI